MKTKRVHRLFKHSLATVGVLALLVCICPRVWSVHDKVRCAECIDELIAQIPDDGHIAQNDSKSAVCLACHDARLGGWGYDPPYVLYGPIELAGGSFTPTLYTVWTGHNIQFGDGILGTTPPGGSAADALSCLSCHDPHKNGNYRNLKTEINGIATPVVALGDPDYREAVYISGTNAFCAACHAKFYGEGGIGGSRGWVKHPVGITIAGAEHADYRSWSLLENRITRVETPSGNPAGGSDARVFCLSCHRAHASPFNDALRWDYGRDAAGCLECHTF